MKSLVVAFGIFLLLTTTASSKGRHEVNDFKVISSAKIYDNIKDPNTATERIVQVEGGVRSREEVRSSVQTHLLLQIMKTKPIPKGGGKEYEDFLNQNVLLFKTLMFDKPSYYHLRDAYCNATVYYLIYHSAKNKTEGKELTNEDINKFVEGYQVSQSLDRQNECRAWFESMASSKGLLK